MERKQWTAVCRNALVIGVGCLAGCQVPGQPSKRSASILDAPETTAITAAEQADAQVALGRVAEQRGEFDQAKAAYRDALARDARRADAYQRLAVLHDKKGEFRESAPLYQRALEASPGNPDVYCDMGYSLCLQRRWTEAEMNLKQALARNPNHQRAHSNLGLVLAHNARTEDAAAEFCKAGCDEAEARENVAFALTTEGHWDEARRQYQLAIRARPDSKTAQQRLKQLDRLVAKLDGRPASPATRDRELVLASAAAHRHVVAKLDGLPASPATRDRELVPASAVAGSRIAGIPWPRPYRPAAGALGAPPSASDVSLTRIGAGGEPREGGFVTTTVPATSGTQALVDPRPK